MIKLSVVIITLNEERNLRRCLSSVKTIADEIVVLDSFSTDKTIEIAESYGARVIGGKFSGYANARREVERLASNEYIMAIDADEALSEELTNSISEVKKNWSKDVYSVSRKTNYCGTWINHCGWYPDRKIRLYKKNSGEWIGKYVHEKYSLFPTTSSGKLNGDLLHYSYYHESEHWERTEKYASMAAAQLFEEGKKANLFLVYLKTGVKFLRVYFKNLGFLDGKTGFSISKISAWGTYQKYSKLYLAHKENRK